MFSKKLRSMRKKCGLTQAELAKMLNISPSAVGMYEQGRREPDSSMLVKIADVFDVSVDFLVDSKKANAMLNGADELAKKVELILRRKNMMKSQDDRMNRKTLDLIVEAVKEGIHQAFEK